MKFKCILVISIYTFVFLPINAQQISSPDISNEKFRPLIIATDALSPISIRVEKQLTKKWNLSARFFGLYGFMANDLRSFVIDSKFLVKPIEKDKRNWYWGLYFKQRYHTVGFSIFDGRAENYFWGGIVGFKSFRGKWSIDYNAGLGINAELPGEIYGQFPLDPRLNVSIGYILFD